MPWFRTDDPRWGPGTGANLTAEQFDENTFEWDSRVTALEDHPPQPISIHDFTQDGDLFNVELTDGTSRGPFTLPVATIRGRGAWQPLTVYTVGDIVSAAGGVYIVIFNHVSASSFDPNASDGIGDFYYDLLFSISVAPVVTVPGATFVPSVYQANSYFRCTNAGGCTVSILPDAAINFPMGTELIFRDASESGAILFEGESGAIINVPHGYLALTAAIGATVTLKKVGASEWDIFGLLAAGSGSP